MSSADSVSARPLVHLTLRGSDGAIGHGEAAPLPSYDGVTVGDVRAGLDACRPSLERVDGQDHAALLAQCAEHTVLPQALAAIDLALWDLAGQRAGQPVWRLLGARSGSDSAPRIEVNATIGAEDRAGAAHEAAAAHAAGFSTVKVKVGLGDDAGRVAAVRAAAGPAMAIRIDANGAWSVEEAVAWLRILEPAGLECCEEPVHGIVPISQVASETGVPIALDETAAEPGALDAKVGTAICLKIARCGGITGVLRDAARARAAGYEIYLASTLDGPVGIAAALHAAAAVAPDRVCGLATLSRLELDDPFPPIEGFMSAPSDPGLGTDYCPKL